LRGALDDIRPDKSFLGFHPHGILTHEILEILAETSWILFSTNHLREFMNV